MELLGEYFIENYENIMNDKNITNKILDFYFDDNGQFLCVSQDDKHYLDISNDEKKQILAKLPITADSLFNSKKKFSQISKEKFLKLFDKED